MTVWFIGGREPARGGKAGANAAWPIGGEECGMTAVIGCAETGGLIAALLDDSGEYGRIVVKGGGGVTMGGGEAGWLTGCRVPGG